MTETALQSGLNLHIIDQEEIAKTFGVCSATIRNWVKKRDFPKPRRIGRKRYWSAEQIRAYFDGQKEGAAHAG